MSDFSGARTDVLMHYVQDILVPRKRYGRIRELITSIDYLAAKAARVGPEHLAGDARAARRLAPDSASAAQLRTLETALMQITRLVTDEPGQLCGQLLARVPRGVAPDLDMLLDDAARWHERTWLRPLTTIHGDLFLRSLGPVSGFAGAVAISDDAALILVGDGTGRLSAWDADSGEQLWSGGAGAAVNAVTYRPGSFEALVALEDGTVARWSLADRRVRPFACDPGRSVAGLAADENIALYCAGASVYAYDLSAGTPLWQGKQHDADVCGVAIAGDRCVSVSGDGALAVWRRRDGRFLRIIPLPADEPLCLASVPGRPLVALGTRNRRVIIVDTDTGQATILRGHANQVCAVTALADGRVLSGSYDGQMLAWDLSDNSSRRVGAHDRWCLAVAAPRRPGPLVSGSDDGVVRVWNADGPEVPHPRKVRMGVRALVVGGGTAYASFDRAILRLDLASATHRPSLTGHRSHIDALAISSDGRLVSGSADKDIRLWDVASGSSRVLKGHTVGVDGLTLTPDETEIISVSRDATWRRWSLAGGTAGPVVRGREPFNAATAVSPDGTLLVTATQEHTIEVWDLRKGRQVLPPLYGHSGYVEHLAFTPDGRTLLSGSWDHSLRVWDAETGQQQACFEHPAWVSDLVLTSDGHLAITAHGGINVFDLSALEPREPFSGSAFHLALAPDDRTLFAIRDQTLCAWDVPTRRELAVFPAEASLTRLAIAGPDLIVVGTSKGAIIPFRLQRA
ncbi:MAG TPA: WD40 repeat domain-containing protein [Streptosporangiaceae bacterium]|nr:WD40 repeat domain-containing protein [Streptosporangiaceae bacterium]